MMVLTKAVVKQINDFVYSQPRTIQEIAQHINKNWRTTNSYVEKISQEEGTLAVRTFRGGTRGALKIVYWNLLHTFSSQFQEKLFSQITQAKRKTDFSPFDIYQYVDSQQRHAFLEQQKDEAIEIKQDILSPFRSAQEQILIFSGNLSWANLIIEDISMLDIFEEVAKKNIPIKIVTTVDITSIKNIQKVNQINEKLGKEMIQIRHCQQPLRAFIIDNKLARFKETKNPAYYKKEELEKETFIFYSIYDPEWISWLKKVFWHLFNSALPADKRSENLKSIEKLNLIK